MKLLPEDPLDLATSYAACHNQKLAFDESWKWFMDTSKVGQNQPLINDFTSFATASKKQESKLCFLISLRQIQPKSIDKNGDGSCFHLMLKKHGKLVIDNFQAPGEVSNCEVLKRGWEELILKVDHPNHETYHNGSGFNMTKGFNITSKIRLTMKFYNVDDVSLTIFTLYY